MSKRPLNQGLPTHLQLVRDLQKVPDLLEVPLRFFRIILCFHNANLPRLCCLFDLHEYFMLNYYPKVYYIHKENMPITILPTVKGQITIPAEIRKKYHITDSTPLIIEDGGKGVISIRVMKMVDPHDSAEFYEDEKGFGLVFKNGVSPQVLIDAINKMDGQDK
jgi:AbrB family looped-hinge helix DNA binding protein